MWPFSPVTEYTHKISSKPISHVPSLHTPLGEKRYREQNQISAYYPKVVMTNEIARSVSTMCTSITTAKFAHLHSSTCTCFELVLRKKLWVTLSQKHALVPKIWLRSQTVSPHERLGSARLQTNWCVLIMKLFHVTSSLLKIQARKKKKLPHWCATRRC